MDCSGIPRSSYAVFSPVHWGAAGFFVHRSWFCCSPLGFCGVVGAVGLVGLVGSVGAAGVVGVVGLVGVVGVVGVLGLLGIKAVRVGACGLFGTRSGRGITVVVMLPSRFIVIWVCCGMFEPVGV